MQDYAAASAFIAALGATDELIDFRAIHDQDKARAAIPFRDTLANAWTSIQHYNNAGYGIFAVINELDGNGRELQNVRSIRAHFVDLDNLSAAQNYERAASWQPSPSFAVQSSAGKFHVYWPVVRYAGNDTFTFLQRKLRQFFDSDKSIVDATRVMRLPGTYHCKAAPHLVTCWSLAGYGRLTTPQALAEALQHVNVTEGYGERHELGDPALAAPSLEWLRFGLSTIDPNTLSRGDWISLTAAIKQAGWTFGETAVRGIWEEWCARYETNDTGENNKQWLSIRNTEVGWNYVVRKSPTLIAHLKLGAPTASTAVAQPSPTSPIEPDNVPPMPVPQPPELDCSGELLSDAEQKVWFKGCVFVTRFAAILAPSGRMLTASGFNGEYGGKKFIIDGQGKVTDEAWKAATRSTLWTVPKVDHIRFVPHLPAGELIVDELGRKGVNTYKPALITRREGDATPFLRHLALMLPNPNDQRILIEYLAHNAKFPGYKIPWAPLIQSAEGVGKGIIKAVIRHFISGPYFHSPNAKQLAESGQQFNAWMRAKLFIVADEIKVDDRRDMIEVLKPMISEAEIEIQGKGHDQDKEDNYSNWMFFSNWKDAIPINKNGRRFAIFYSAIQSVDDIARLGMDDRYFDWLRGWLGINEGHMHRQGLEIVTNYLLNYPIERGAITMRAPATSSTMEALANSQSPIEQLITEAIADGLPGFCGGWISSLAVMSRARAAGIRTPSSRVVQTILEGMGFTLIGRAPRPYFQEDKDNRATLFGVVPGMNVAAYAAAQGYGS
jgi:hypothetical protein